MSIRREVIRGSATAALLLGAVLTLLLVPVAMAAAATGAGPDGGAEASSTAASDTAVPAVLATTGIDLTTPIVLGLSILLLGTALVAWAVLRGSGGAHRRAPD